MALYEEKYQLKGNAWKYVNKYKSKKQQKAAFCRQSLLLENEQ